MKDWRNQAIGFSAANKSSPGGARRILIGLCAAAFCLAICFDSASALDARRAITQYLRHTWLTEDGLPLNTVTAVLQTRDGYLWVGTQEGLARFDGQNFTVYNSRSSKAFVNNNIEVLYEDRRSNLWIGTHGGLICLQNGEFRLFTKNAGLPFEMILAIREDSAGNLWLGTDGGLVKFGNERFETVLTKEKGLQGDYVWAVEVNSDDAVWLGGGGGLYRWHNNQLTTFTAKDGLPHDNITVIKRRSNDELWIGTHNGVAFYSNGKFTTFGKEEGLTVEVVRALCEDRDGNLWVGMIGGLFRLQDNRFVGLSESLSALGDDFLALHEDREGSLWTGGIGLTQFSNAKFYNFSKDEGVAGDEISAVTQDSRGQIWLTTNAGLSLLDKNGQATDISKKFNLPNIAPLAIEIDSQDVVWFSDTNGRLYRFDNGRLQTFNIESGALWSIYEDSKKRLWLGTSTGLRIFEKGRIVKSYTTAEGLPHNFITVIKETKNGDLWIGTLGGGAALLSGGKFVKVLNKENGLDDDTIFALQEDEAGAIWFGTDAGGLSRYFNGNVTTFRTKNGLFDDRIFSIMPGGDGNFWMSCNRGVFTVSRLELAEFADGRRTQINSKVYGLGDGMKSSECNGGTQPSALQTDDGRIWFTSQKGVVVVNPAETRVNQQTPPIVINAVSIDEKLQSSAAEIKIAAENQRLQIDYAALSFLAPDKIRFRYRLEGFDRDWVEVGNRRAAFYTNLRPGSYQFRVIAANSDGVWNETGASLSLSKQPFFYQTWWFYLLSAAAIIIAGINFHQWRARRQLAKINEKHRLVLSERTRLAREIHDTLTQGLTGISAQLQAARIAAAKGFAGNLDKHLQIANELTSENLAEARQWIRALSVAAPDSDYLAEALRDFARKTARREAIKLDCEIENALPVLSVETTDNILRIAQEAVNNAVKHARAALIKIELRRRLHELTLCVSDDGCGFDPEQQTAQTGFGQRSMRERAASIGAEIHIESGTGNGTIVKLIVPLTT